MASEVWFVVGVIIVAVLIIVKFSTFKQNIALKLGMFLFIFLLLSGGYLVIKNNISLSSLDDITKAGRLYTAWLGNVIGNIAKVSGYALNQDWDSNVTSPG